ncbi:MAG: DUF937 domain-containing protein [Actinomycetes bacterium]
MAAVDDIKSSLDLDQIAQLLGTDRATADHAVDEALGQLVGAMGSNVSDADGAVSLTRALGDHVSSHAYGPQLDVSHVDTRDGEKIVNHVFSPTQIQSLGSGASGSLLNRLLPILAPIVMGYLASRFQDYLRGQSGGAPGQPGQQPGQGGLGDILGDLFGGGRGSGGSSGGGFGDILGDLLGGGSQTPQAPPTPQAPSSGGTGGFNVPSGGDSGLRMPESGAAPTATPQQQQAPAARGGDVLGSILSDLLLGRR